MPNPTGRNIGRQGRRRHCNGATVVTNRKDCCMPPETIGEELYSETPDTVLVENCCDGVNGCRQMEAQHRCGFWPSFAHPRWLSCRELHNHGPMDPRPANFRQQARPYNYSGISMPK